MSELRGWYIADGRGIAHSFKLMDIAKRSIGGYAPAACGCALNPTAFIARNAPRCKNCEKAIAKETK